MREKEKRNMTVNVSPAFYHFQWSDQEDDCDHAHTDEELRQLIKVNALVGEPFEIIHYSSLDLEDTEVLGHGLYLLTGDDPVFATIFEEGDLIGLHKRLQGS